MKGAARLSILLATVLLLSGCGRATPDSLTGTYSVEGHGQLNEVMRVEKKGSEYFVSEKRKGRWVNPEKVRSVTKKQLEEMLKQSVSVPFAGLVGKDFAIFKMPAGWRNDKFQTKTGYWLATIFGPVELHKE